MALPRDIAHHLQEQADQLLHLKTFQGFDQSFSYAQLQQLFTVTETAPKALFARASL